ncbi:putative lipoprotein [Myxococcus hansupus]|uniref:Putative lipoprotein n=1 Tax=Pseudomyxococcus hansupus TaxID=1297742 RepID=A0A0H4WU21_9BACT|nr:hypothetical protein [Myxococcus hansupus]AKQ66961.1 putative lipoprotein [Myxococcus hansupus]
MRRLAVLVLMTPLFVACATSQALPRGTACDRGQLWACNEWGDQLLQDGDRSQAEDAFVRACDGGSERGCLALGRLRIADGNLAGAEAPLVTVYENDSEEGALALAELYEARGGPDHARAAAKLRHEAPALDKPPFDFAMQYRIGAWRPTADLALNIQPMAFLDRRLSIGTNLAYTSLGVSEWNGFVGYQHFARSWLVPYGRVMMGTATRYSRDPGFNVGAEVGAKLAWSYIGHVNVAAGMSQASGGYMSVGVGLNGIFVLLALLHVR